MRTLVTILLAIGTLMTNAQQSDLDHVRDIFFSDEPEKVKSVSIFKYLEKKDNLDAVLLCYKGVSRAMMAETTSNVYKQLRYFKDGKSMIEDAVIQDPQNTEIRLLRYSVQSNIPAFLMYNDRETDLEFIKDGLTEMKVEGYPENYLQVWMKLVTSHQEGKFADNSDY